MKLWQKIFLWSLFIVMLSLSSLGILLLKNDFNSSIKRQTDNTISEHNYMISNINNIVITKRLQNNSIVLTLGEIVDVMDSIFSNENSNNRHIVALLNEYNEMLYSSFKISFDDEFIESINSLNDSSKDTGKNSDTVTPTICTQIVEREGEKWLNVGSRITLERQELIFITSTNINDIYESYNSQFNYTKLICIVLSLICAVFLIVLVKILFLPLAHLNNTTHAIAEGDYSKRIKVKKLDELGELAYNMNIMADSVEENILLLQETADNRKQFINNLTHEMKTPLTSILGFADIMRIKRNITPEEISEYSGIIFEEATRLKSLSGKLMEIITIGETKIEFVPTDSQELFSQIILVMQPILKTNDITLNSQCDSCTISIDTELFKSMLFNILDNAIKASSKGASIELNGTFSDGMFTIWIKDSGIGISSKDLAKIKEPFYMVNKARSRKAGGAGLGLALCEQIANIHNAEFDITSELGKGTSVQISIKGDTKIEKN